MSLSRLGAQWGRKEAVTRRGAAADEAAAPTGNEKIESLTKYIPTETITLFIAAVAAFNGIEELADREIVNPWVLYGIGAILSPIVLVVVAYTTYLANNPGPTPSAEFKVPWFRAVAALLAFLVWAAAVPGLFYTITEGTPEAAAGAVAQEPDAPGNAIFQIALGFVALVVSQVLSWAERIFER